MCNFFIFRFVTKRTKKLRALKLYFYLHLVYFVKIKDKQDKPHVYLELISLIISKYS